MGKGKILTKSKYLIGLQCLKYLWIACNKPSRIPKPDSATQYRFDQGHLVNTFAKKLFPEGIAIPTDDFMGNIEKTKDLIRQHKPLFEAGILAGDTYSRIDILNPASNGTWDIIEAKSSTKVKDEHVQDVSFQKYCCEKFGLKINKCILVYINNKYIKHGDIDPNGLFTEEDITDDVNKAMEGIQERVNNMIATINFGKCPDVVIGQHCKNNPYDCPLIGECWSFLPSDNVFELYYGGHKSFELFRDGIYAIKDIPDGFDLSDRQIIQKKCARCNKPYIDKEAIKSFLSTFRYPLYYLDFETFMSAIPLLDGTSPYQQIPFQFSLHVLKDPNSKVEHYSFLADGAEDPRPKFLSSLKDVLGSTGSIVVYYKSFEEKRLKELSNTFPENKTWIENALARIVDLRDIFSNFYYCNCAQKGSTSLKDVLPAVTGISYEGMNVSSGEDASISFMNITFHGVTEEERVEARKDLEKYCCLDTEGMFRIVEEMSKLIGNDL